MRAKFVGAHVSAIVLHTFCAVYAFATPYAYETSIPTKLMRVRYDGDDVDVYYKLASTNTFSIPSVILLHGIVAVVTALFHMFLYIPLHYYYGQVIWSQGFLPLRWVEYAITCTIMTVSSVSSAGTDDFTSVLSVVFLGVCLQSLGAGIEQRKETVYFLLGVGFMLSLGVSTSSIWYAFSSAHIEAPQVLELVAYTFFYALFPINCAVDAVYRKGRFIQTDWIYIVLSMSSKVGLFWLQVGEVEKKTRGGWWPDVQIYVLGVLCPLLMLMLGIYLTPEVTPEHREAPQMSTGKATLLQRVCSFRVLPPAKVVVETKIERRYFRSTAAAARR